MSDYSPISSISGPSEGDSPISVGSFDFSPNTPETLSPNDTSIANDTVNSPLTDDGYSFNSPSTISEYSSLATAEIDDDDDDEDDYDYDLSEDDDIDSYDDSYDAWNPNGANPYPVLGGGRRKRQTKKYKTRRQRKPKTSKKSRKNSRCTRRKTRMRKTRSCRTMRRKNISGTCIRIKKTCAKY